MKPHSDTVGIERRMQAVVDSHMVRRSGTTFRMVKPKWTKDRDVINGKGALKESGRWHVKCTFCVTYASFTPETALAESLAAAHYFKLPVNKLLPKVLVSLRYKLSRVLDLTDGRLRQKLKISKDVICSTDWWTCNRNRDEAVTQAIGRCANNFGVEGLIVPSAADHSGMNLIVFPGNIGLKSVFRLEMKVQFPR